MSKYGSGVSMKSVMEMEMAEVKAALDRSNITPEDRTIVLDALKEAFYQWAHTNAVACAFEENVAREDQELYWRAARPTAIVDAVMKKMVQTYPDWDDEEEL